MELDDFFEPEVGVAVAVTALVATPKVRKVVKRGLVYGLAALLTAKNKIVASAKAMADEAQQPAGPETLPPIPESVVAQ